VGANPPPPAYAVCAVCSAVPLPAFLHRTALDAYRSFDELGGASLNAYAKKVANSRRNLASISATLATVQRRLEGMVQKCLDRRAEVWRPLPLPASMGAPVLTLP
jgi:hypothetical protein